MKTALYFLVMLLAVLSCTLPVPNTGSAADEPNPAPTQLEKLPETTPSPTATPKAECVVNASVLTLRACGGIQCSAQAWLREGTVLTVLDQQNTWMEVRTADEAIGWVHSKFCTGEQP